MTGERDMIHWFINGCSKCTINLSYYIYLLYINIILIYIIDLYIMLQVARVGR